MNFAKSLIATSVLAISTTLLASPAQAQQAPEVTITANENGNGTIAFLGGQTFAMPFSQTNDPTPGGLANVLTYNLLGPPSLVAGDVILSEGVGAALVPSDVIRFLTTGSAIFFFYSDNSDGVDGPADTGLPTAFLPNNVTLAETGAEGSNGAFYTPTANQPGFIAGFAVTYHFISDSSGVPEPATWAMMVVGFGAIGIAFRRVKKLQPAFA